MPSHSQVLRTHMGERRCAFASLYVTQIKIIFMEKAWVVLTCLERLDDSEKALMRGVIRYFLGGVGCPIRTARSICT